MNRLPEPSERRRLHRGNGAGVWLLACALFGPSALPSSGLVSPEVAASIESRSPVGTVLFPHLYHVDEVGFECRDCHHETSAAPLRIPHPEFLEDFWIECEGCHRGEGLTEPQSCANCHANGAEVGDETLSAKVVIHRSCWACHEVGTGQEASRGCTLCHEVGE